MKKIFARSAIALASVLAFAFLMAPPASATEDESGEWLSWRVPVACNPQVLGQTNPSSTDCGPTDVIFPQEFVGFGEIAPQCGEWIQQDWNKAGHPDYGNVLEWTEDHEYATKWRFVYGGDCETPAPIVTPFSSEVWQCGDVNAVVSNWTMTSTPTTWDYATLKWNWSPEVRADLADTLRPLTPAEVVAKCGEPPAPPKPPVPPVTLADTGIDPVGGSAVALGLLALGMTFLGLRRKRSIA